MCSHERYDLRSFTARLQEAWTQKKQIEFPNQICMFVNFTGNVVWTKGFTGLKFAKSVVKILHGEGSIDWLRSCDRYVDVLFGEPNLK